MRKKYISITANLVLMFCGIITIVQFSATEKPPIFDAVDVIIRVGFLGLSAAMFAGGGVWLLHNLNLIPKANDK